MVITLVGISLLGCGLCNFSATLWGLGALGRAPTMGGADLPPSVRKDAKLKIRIHGSSTGEFTIEVIESRGSWVKARRQIPGEQQPVWINFQNVSHVWETPAK
jgi:hypothetical protein